METRMDVRHFFEVVRMWKPMALRNFKRKKTKKQKQKDAQERNMHKEREWKEERKKEKRKKTGSVYRIVKSSTIYTASFKTQMSSTI